MTKETLRAEGSQSKSDQSRKRESKEGKRRGEGVRVGVSYSTIDSLKPCLMIVFQVQSENNPLVLRAGLEDAASIELWAQGPLILQ